jgi:hypothetical protein
VVDGLGGLYARWKRGVVSGMFGMACEVSFFVAGALTSLLRWLLCEVHMFGV